VPRQRRSRSATKSRHNQARSRRENQAGSRASQWRPRPSITSQAARSPSDGLRRAGGVSAAVESSS
jgi:hypothetical protein